MPPFARPGIVTRIPPRVRTEFQNYSECFRASSGLRGHHLRKVAVRIADKSEVKVRISG